MSERERDHGGPPVFDDEEAGQAVRWLPEVRDSSIEEAETTAEPGQDPDADFPSPYGPPASRTRSGQPTRTRSGQSAAPRTNWLPPLKDSSIEEAETTAEPGQDPDADFPSPVGWSPGGAASERLTFNGINAATGEYWTPPMLESDFARVLQSRKRDTEEADYLRKLQEGRKSKKRYRILKAGVDPKDLAAAGWGVVFPKGGDPRVREALRPLLDLRQRQIRSEIYFREYFGDDGYSQGDSAQVFLSRHGGSTGPVDPERMPYYLLLVGSPEEIPYHVQSQLGVRHAVGRIHFDVLEDYQNYAQSVVAAEEQWYGSRPQEVVFFSSANERDKTMQRSHAELVEPLSQMLKRHHGWQVRVIAGREAGRERLQRLLGGAETPTVLFTASHGLRYELHERKEQRRFQGALICGEWPGPGSELERRHFFAAENVLPGASLKGSMCFHFACYSAGTPHYDSFGFPAEEKSAVESLSAGYGFGAEIAMEPFVAALPKRLLGLPEGRGALAVVGHVDRAWTTSFSYLSESGETVVFESLLEELLSAFPLGHAMRYMSRRYADLASDVTIIEDPSAPPVHLDATTRARMWRAQSDARNFVILGDPAVRLPSVDNQPLRRWRDGRPRVEI